MHIRGEPKIDEGFLFVEIFTLQYPHTVNCHKTLSLTMSCVGSVFVP